MASSEAGSGHHLRLRSASSLLQATREVRVIQRLLHQIIYMSRTHPYEIYTVSHSAYVRLQSGRAQRLLAPRDPAALKRSSGNSSCI